MADSANPPPPLRLSVGMFPNGLWSLILVDEVASVYLSHKILSGPFTSVLVGVLGKHKKRMNECVWPDQRQR